MHQKHYSLVWYILIIIEDTKPANTTVSINWVFFFPPPSIEIPTCMAIFISQKTSHMRNKAVPYLGDVAVQLQLLKELPEAYKK